MPLLDNIDKIVHFKAVAEAGSFSQAARVLRLTQPTLTKSVQILEDSLSKKLFVRTSRGVKLTDAGLALHRLSDSIVSQCRNTEDSIRNPSLTVSGELTIATYPPLAATIYPEIIQLVEKLAPNLRISFKTHIANAVLTSWLASQEVDVVILAKGSIASPTVTTFDFAKSGYGFYVAQPRQWGPL